ncbi:SMP-30/gluconolactonase/LRE family protein [Microbacterium sp. Bi128]|uniref:SMP-30/gluconolactonase/LRE family protein n=1 Tax=Microbacterium sp. Bi128 TaxID=2821115 RepID=UPI001E0DE22C|nr:SMP-30/gluconolactonase/LRE family protein [Microbacterium sp. Bi128]CAH0137303.1 6-deoxy-6-sulfogluconolactonase [Microbacterium sp. Bi128]
MPDAHQWSDPVTVHGEGPIWNPLVQRFQLVDMLEGDVLTLEDGVVVDRIHVDTVAAVVRPRLYGGLIVAGERDVILIDPDGEQHRVNGAGVPAGSRFNEGTCAPDGSFWCGTMDYDATPGAGVVVRLDPGTLEFTRIADSVTISNGLAFEDSGTAYYVDSATRRIDRLRVHAGAVTDRTSWVDLSGAGGVPDGICLDADGGVWVAMYGGSAVRRFDADGILTDVIDLPVAHVTACALGGSTGRELLITTSRLGLEAPSGPAGAVFRALVDIPGVHTPPFGS